MAPTWLVALSWASLAVMEIVWLVTVLYIGPAAVRLYWNWGRPEAFSRRR
ncbi:hypothetical protein ACWER9_25470 [Micromonospora sp. NPDC003944]